MPRTQERHLLLWYWKEIEYVTIYLNKNETNSLRLNLNPEHSGTPDCFTVSAKWQHCFFAFHFFSFLTSLAAYTIKYSLKPFHFNSPHNSKGLGKYHSVFLKALPLLFLFCRHQQWNNWKKATCHSWIHA